MFAERPNEWMLILGIRWRSMNLGIALSDELISGPRPTLKQFMDQDKQKGVLSGGAL